MSLQILQQNHLIILSLDVVTHLIKARTFTIYNIQTPMTDEQEHYTIHYRNQLLAHGSAVQKIDVYINIFMQ